MGYYTVTLRNEASGWVVHTETVAADGFDAAVKAVKAHVPYADQISFRSAVTEVAAPVAQALGATVAEKVKSAEEEIAEKLPPSVIEFIRREGKVLDGQSE
jgi:lipopolysaccharide biosynthesis protein